MSLESVSVAINGPYNNGRGASRPRAAHKVTSEVDHEQFDAAMIQVLDAMQAAEDALPTDDRRFGYNIVGHAGDTAIGACGFSKDIIATIAESEIKPEWILEASPEDVVSVAGLMVAARNVARQYHMVDMWATNSS